MENHLARILALEAKEAASVSDETLYNFFARISPLMYRSKVRKELQQFQLIVVASIAKKLEALREEFQEGNGKATNNFPGVAGQISWCLGIVERVKELDASLHHVFGPHWTKLARGTEIQTGLAKLSQDASPDSLFQSWESDMKGRNFRVAG